LTKTCSAQFSFKDHNGCTLDLPPGKVVCVGRNYAEHAKELGNPVPKTPLFFIKPKTAIVDLEPEFKMPLTSEPCHFETEIAVLIGKQLKSSICNEVSRSDTEIENAIAGYGIALDLTLRQLQNKLKAKGHPWEIAKSFDGACPMGAFYTGKLKPNEAGLECSVNEEVRQRGFAIEMIVGIVDLLKLITQYFTLEPGDVVMTGTPAGVGPLIFGDKFECKLLSKSHDGNVSELVKYNSLVKN